VVQRELGLPLGLQFSLHNLGQVAQAEGDLAAARARFAEGLEVNRRAGQADGLGMSLFYLGDLALDQGDLAAARARFAESLDVYRRTGSRMRLAIVLEGVAGLAAAQGQPARALRLAGAADALREAAGTRYLPPPRARLERRLAPARRALSRQAQAALWTEGRAMPLEHAIAAALGGAEDAPGARPSVGPGPPAPPAGRAWASPRAGRAGPAPREWEALALLLEGTSNRAIAARLRISPHTVVRHVANVLAKLEAASRGQAVALALGVGAAPSPGTPGGAVGAERGEVGSGVARQRPRQPGGDGGGQDQRAVYPRDDVDVWRLRQRPRHR